jgi:glycerol-3-phosphate dehydrogenase subunit B
MTYDVVVIGAGVSGLSAALRLVQEGRRVLVLAKGVGSTQLSPTTIDVLGRAPGLVTQPGVELDNFIAEHPQHPYARVGLDILRESVKWFADQFEDYHYVGSLDRNYLLPTAMGGVKPSALVPETMSPGDLAEVGPMAIIGLRALKDFYPRLAAANLAAAHLPSDAKIEARGVVVDPPTRGNADLGSLGFARMFDQPEWRSEFASRLSPKLETGEVVGLPAVLGLKAPHTVWSELSEQLGHPVFEIPTLPPSVPGMRLFKALKHAITGRGGRVIIGSEVSGAETTRSRVTSVSAVVAAREVNYAANDFVLATGGWASGGITMDSYRNVTEGVFGLPVAGLPEEPSKRRFAPGYFDVQPTEGSGIAVDDELRPLDASGEVTLDNVRVTGASIAGAVSWREKSGEGISLASGYKSAMTILEGKG